MKNINACHFTSNIFSTVNIIIVYTTQDLNNQSKHAYTSLYFDEF